MLVERVGILHWSWNNTLNRIRVTLQVGDLNEMSNTTCFSSKME